MLMACVWNLETKRITLQNILFNTSPKTLFGFPNPLLIRYEIWEEEYFVGRTGGLNMSCLLSDIPNLQLIPEISL